MIKLYRNVLGKSYKIFIYFITNYLNLFAVQNCRGLDPDE